MSARKTRSRIKWRDQGGTPRAYGDFRDVGGGREALRVRGESRATTDQVIAEKLVADRLAELQEQKRNGVLLGIKRAAKLGAFSSEHLIQKAKSANFSETWLADSERMLGIAIEFFGADRDLAAISVSDVQSFVAMLGGRKNGRGGTLGGGAVRHHLNVLSNLYKRAQSEGCVAPGFNPCTALMDKPKGKPAEAHWLEIHEAAVLLDTARTFELKGSAALVAPFIYPLIATYLLTGARETEVLGLEVGDINFERKTVTFRPNSWRRLKTKGSHRTVPLWPQLETILRSYMRSGDSPRVGGLLFPSSRLLEAGMVTDFRKALDAVAGRAGWKDGEVRTKAFRHTYCAARLQTLDGDSPVSQYTVGRELGHATPTLVQKVYGHLGEIHHRAAVVEYRVEQHAARIKERQTALEAKVPLLRLA